ncbi:MAG: methyltransferase domain-containing protein [Cyclobacteriaceae bacterium]
MKSFVKSLVKKLPSGIREYTVSINKTRVELKLNRIYKKKNSLALVRHCESHDDLKIDLGSTEPREGFLTADLNNEAELVFDFLKPFPFLDNSVDLIYTSHVFEHFNNSELKFILSEIRRVLKKEGELIVCVPNAELFFDLYNNFDKNQADKLCAYKPAFQFYSKIDVVNYIAYMGGQHKIMFDNENLLEIIKSAGYSSVHSRSFKPGLDLEARKNESIYARAVK